MQETFISRIDGTIKNRKDFPPTINEGGQLIGDIPNIFRTDNEVTSGKNIQNSKIALKAIWNYSDEIINKIAEHFETPTESLLFIEIYDEYHNFDDAWRTYCIRENIEHEIDHNPFI